VVLAFFFVPSFFVSGLSVPITSEGWGRLTSDIFPSTHFMTVARGVFVKGVGPRELWRELLFLGGMYLGGMLIALATFRKRLM
jgi:ABC-2 type transport system permease protein